MKAGRLCPACKGPLYLREGQCTTGVVAPDGYRESGWETWLECRDCGRVFAENEVYRRRADGQ